MGNTPHENKKRIDAMTVAWPSWRTFHNIMSTRGRSRPPLEVMEWLRDFRTALLGGVETFERHIAGGGLAIEVIGTCDCNRTHLTDVTMTTKLLVEAYRITDFDSLFSIYEQLAWGSTSRAQVRSLIFDSHPNRIGELEAEEALAWLHANHEVYNRAQIRLIEDTIGLVAFREILERDLAFENSDDGPDWGNLLRKDYTQSILDRLAA